MKCEPHGPINLNKKNAERLGLYGPSDAQLKLISSLIIAKPVSPSEAALACLQIPIIQKNIAVKYIDSKPPTLRTRMINRSRVLGFHPIDIYCNRPHEYDDMTFTDYFKRFDMEKICRRNVTSFGKDKLGFHIYETHKITRFTDFHPIHNSEAFFFNVLLRTIPFRNENDLLSATNIKKSYIRECHNRGIISNVDNIQEYLLQYAHCNLIDTEKQSQLLEQLLEDYPYLNPEHIPQDIHVSTPSSNAERIHTKRTPDSGATWPPERPAFRQASLSLLLEHPKIKT